MIKLLIIADDFTGALDTGVQFSKRNIPAFVSTDLNLDNHMKCGDAEVLVLDTESRHVSPGEAYAIVNKLTRDALALGVEYIYKKTDSALRGNIGSELTAVIDACEDASLMFIPAYPETMRTTRNGIQYVEGIPVHETVFSKDILNPVGESFIPDIIRKQSDVNVKVIHANGRSALESIKDKKLICVFDAQTNHDICEIGKLLGQKNMLKLTAGCAGFARVLPELIRLKAHPTEDERQEPNMLTICGSIHERSLKQVQSGIDRGYPALTLTPEQKLVEGYWDTDTGNGFISQIVAGIQANNHFIIKMVDQLQDTGQTDVYAARMNLVKKGDISAAINRNTGTLVNKILSRTKIGLLVIFGGDTAIGIMDAIGCQGIIPGIEIEPGVVLSRIAGSGYRLQMVSKAGGFGSDDVFSNIVEYQEERRSCC